MDIKGTATPVRQPPEKDWNNKEGWKAVHVWEGTKDQLDALGITLVQTRQYSDISISPRDGAVWRLRAIMIGLGDGSQEEVTESWEIDGSTEQPDIFSHYKCDGGVNHVSSEELSLIKQALDDPALWDRTIENLTVGTPGYELALLVKREQRSFQRSFWVLRYSLSGSIQYMFNIDSPAKVDHVYSWAQLPWSGISRTMAVNDFLGRIRQAGDPYAAPAGYRWGWLMQAPKLGQAFSGKVSVTQEWWYSCWSTFIYDDA